MRLISCSEKRKKKRDLKVNGEEYYEKIEGNKKLAIRFVESFE